MNGPSLTSRVLKTELVQWRNFKYIQQESNKEQSKEAKQQLKNSLQQNNFTQPFYVWEEPATGDLYCLDGYQRGALLLELEQEGAKLPDKLPATFIKCKNKKQAASLVVIYSSLYSRFTYIGLFDFIKEYDIMWQHMKETIEVPGIDNSTFFGDLGKDFSMRNEELSVNQFLDQMDISFCYTTEKYFEVMPALEKAMTAYGVENKEDLLIKLLTLEPESVPV